MRRLSALIFGTLSVGCLVFVLRLKPEPHATTNPVISRPPGPMQEPQIAELQARLLLGDRVLARYSQPESNLQNDLTLFQNFLGNVFLLEKQSDPRHYATNEDLAFFLMGKGSRATPYLSADSPVLNDRQQLVDRHGSPLIVHPLSRAKLEIRSSGPDRIPYTEDDVVR